MSMPQIYVISAPSGTGKTTLNIRLVKEHPSLALSVSYTTRAPRPMEIPGTHYHFVDEDFFQKEITKGNMLEYAQVFGTWYGTSISEIERIHKRGQVPLLEIDVQGFQICKEKLPHVRGVFVLPPSIKVLWERLEGRGTEPLTKRSKRLFTAHDEISKGSCYDAFVVNRDLERAYIDLRRAVLENAEGTLSKEEGAIFCQQLLDEFRQSNWIKELVGAS